MQVLEAVNTAQQARSVSALSAYLEKAEPFAGLHSDDEREATYSAFLQQDCRTVEEGVPLRGLILFLRQSNFGTPKRNAHIRRFVTYIDDNSNQLYPVIPAGAIFVDADDQSTWEKWREEVLEVSTKRQPIEAAEI